MSSTVTLSVHMLMNIYSGSVSQALYKIPGVLQLASSRGSSIFNLLRNIQTDFISGCCINTHFLSGFGQSKSFAFSHDYQNQFFNSKTKANGSFSRFTFLSIANVAILSIPIHEHRVYQISLGASLISCNNVLHFFSVKFQAHMLLLFLCILFF